MHDIINHLLNSQFIILDFHLPALSFVDDKLFSNYTETNNNNN